MPHTECPECEKNGKHSNMYYEPGQPATCGLCGKTFAVTVLEVKPAISENCPVCGRPYIKAKPTEFGGMAYAHKIETTFSLWCQQSSASYLAEKTQD